MEQPLLRAKITVVIRNMLTLHILQMYKKYWEKAIGFYEISQKRFNPVTVHGSFSASDGFVRQ